MLSDRRTQIFSFNMDLLHGKINYGFSYTGGGGKNNSILADLGKIN